MSTRTRTTEPAPRRSRRQAPEPDVRVNVCEVDEEIDNTEEPDEEVRRVGGLAVVNDEPMPTNLSRPGRIIPSQTIRILTLEDDSQVHACADATCEVYGSRGEVQSHRWQVHGFNGANRRAQRAKATPEDILTALMAMPVGQLIEMATDIADWEQAFAGQREQFEAQRSTHRIQVNELHQQLAAANKRIRTFEQTFARLGFVPKEDD